MNEADPADRYARLYSPAAVDQINALHVLRYGLGGYTEADGRIDDMARVKAVYEQYASQYKKRFKWIRPGLFKPTLAEHLAQDTQTLTELLRLQGQWDPAHDQKLLALRRLVNQTHAKAKVLVFTQFADTAFRHAAFSGHQPFFAARPQIPCRIAPGSPSLARQTAMWQPQRHAPQWCRDAASRHPRPGTGD